LLPHIVAYFKHIFKTYRLYKGLLHVTLAKQ
jgi:hypothetical protein